MKRPYKPHNRKLRHVEKKMPAKRRQRGMHYIAGCPGFINSHWCFKKMPKGETP